MDAEAVVGPFSLLNRESREVSFAQFVRHVDDSGIRDAFALPLEDVYSNLYAVPKDLRPMPESYLTSEFMTAHTEKFVDGAARVDATVSFNSRYQRDIEAGLPFGRPDAVFVSPEPLINKLYATDAPAVESTLGFKSGTFSSAGSMTRTYIYKPIEFGLRFARGTEGGANEWWVPGGYTFKTTGGAGVPEMVTDHLPSPLTNPHIKVYQ